MTGSGNTFSATIPAMPDGTEVSFTVSVENEAGFVTTSDKYSFKVGDPATDWSKLKLNEVYGAGADEEKFFELYNASDYPIKLTGVTISKDEGNCWTGIDGEVVPAKGFFVIQGTKRSLERSLSSGVSAKKGVKLEVFDPDGKSVTSVQHGDPADATVAIAIHTGIWARIPDGGAWKNVTNPTAGKANDATGAQDDAQLK